MITETYYQVIVKLSNRIKILFWLVLFLVYSNCANAQDILIKSNGDNLNVKVEKITDTNIEYRLFNNLEGPIYTINRLDVFQIKYKNGIVENYSTTKESNLNVNKINSDSDINTEIKKNQTNIETINNTKNESINNNEIHFSIEPSFYPSIGQVTSLNMGEDFLFDYLPVFTPDISVNFNVNFSDHFAIGIGGGFCEIGYNVIDNFPYTITEFFDSNYGYYDETYTGSVSATNRLSFLKFPVAIKVKTGLESQFGLYFESGISFAALVKSKDVIKYDITITDDFYSYPGQPDIYYDSGTDINHSVAGTSPFNIILFGTIGASFPLSDKISINAGLRGEGGLIDLNTKDVNKPFVDAANFSHLYSPYTSLQLGMQLSFKCRI